MSSDDNNESMLTDDEGSERIPPPPPPPPPQDTVLSSGSSNSEPNPQDVFVRKCVLVDYEVYEYVIPTVARKIGEGYQPSVVLNETLEEIQQNWGGHWEGRISHDLGAVIPVEGASFLDFTVDETRITITKSFPAPGA